MKVVDISWPITPAITEYKNKKTVEFHTIKEFDSDRCRESNISLNAHTGTHIDAPSHFLQDGITIDQIELENCFGPSLVLDMTRVKERIGKEELIAQEHKQRQIKKDDIILLKTLNSNIGATEKFDPEFVYLSADGAEYLASKGIRAVGIDYLGIERSQQGHPTHYVLLSKEILIIEGLRLAHIKPGEYYFCCLPLNTMGLEAAPARAVLIDELF